MMKRSLKVVSGNWLGLMFSDTGPWIAKISRFEPVTVRSPKHSTDTKTKTDFQLERQMKIQQNILPIGPE
jgi:hypothetical protein